MALLLVGAAACGSRDAAGERALDGGAEDSVEVTSANGAASDAAADDSDGDGDSVQTADAVATPSDADAFQGDGDSTTPLDAPPAGVDEGCPVGTSCPLGLVQPCQVGRCDDLGQCVAVADERCCDVDDECSAFAPDGPCRSVRCLAGYCTQLSWPGCCVTQGDCDDGEACTVDRCVAGSGRCLRCPADCSSTCAARPLDTSFDGASLAGLGFEVDDQRASDPVSWRLSGRRWVRPPSAAYLGRQDCPSYYSGALSPGCEPVDAFGQDSQRVAVTLRSPSIQLADEGPGQLLTFWLWSEVEPFLGGGAEPDVLRVVVEESGGGEPAWVVASSLDIGKTTLGGWRLMVSDLSHWRGRSVRLGFAFDTFDGQRNLFEGVYIDELAVVDSCSGGGCCNSDADCGDAVVQACERARCVQLVTGPGSFCAVVPKAPNTVCEACASGDDCEDGNPCTNDSCGPDGECIHAPFCCFETTVLEEDFEDSLDAFFIEDDQPTEDQVGWRISTAAAAQGSGSAWFGDPSSGTYATGAAVSGALTTEPLAIPAAAPGTPGSEVAFFVSLSTEWDGTAYLNPLGLDRLSLSVVEGGVGTEIWSSDSLLGTTAGAFEPVAVTLGAWQGRTVRLRFAFDSVDAENNGFDGPRIDGLAVRTRCE